MKIGRHIRDPPSELGNNHLPDTATVGGQGGWGIPSNYFVVRSSSGTELSQLQYLLLPSIELYANRNQSTTKLLILNSCQWEE